MENKNLTLKYWVDRWDVDNITFHKSEANSNLLEFEEHLPTSCRVLVPLCGKSVDLLYLANKGHEVHGCEFVTKAVKDFFEEQHLEYVTTTLPLTDIVVYKATQKAITIYQGDFFKLNSDNIGKFGAIWDRGSFVAINPLERNRYIELIISLMDIDCKYLLVTVEVHGNGYNGPPYSITPPEICELFKTFCNIKKLVTRRIAFDRPYVETCERTCSLLTLRK